MSTRQISDMSDECEHSEVEGVVKIEVNEDQLPNPQFIYETDEEPLDEDEVFKSYPLENNRYTMKWWTSRKNQGNMDWPVVSIGCFTPSKRR